MIKELGEDMEKVSDYMLLDYIRMCTIEKIVKELEKFKNLEDILILIKDYYEANYVNNNPPFLIDRPSNKVAMSRTLSRGRWEMTYRAKRLLTFAISKFDYSNEKKDHYYNDKLLKKNVVSITVSEYTYFTGLCHDSALRELREVGRELCNKEITVKNEYSIAKIRPVEGHLYDGADTLLVGFTDDMLEHIDGFNDVKDGKKIGFVSYKIDNALSLDQKSWRLYELISGYHPSNIKLKVDDLKFALNCSETSNSAFFQKVLKPSVQTLNDYIFPNLTYTKIKRGRSISELIFSLT